MTPVLATPIELAAAPIEALKTAPIEAVAPTGDPVELAQVVEPPPAAAAEPAAATCRDVPTEASQLIAVDRNDWAVGDWRRFCAVGLFEASSLNQVTE